MSQQPQSSAVVRFAGFTAGLLLVVLCGWALLLGGWWLAHRAGISVVLVMSLAAALSLGLFLLLERGHWLSHLMGLRVPPGAPSVRSSILFWLFGLGWLFVKTSIIDPDRPDAEGAPGEKSKTPPAPRDPAREAVETIVFVVVLVLLLKLFVTEAFVIPTGSMAESLLGYHQTITCQQCGHEFPVNSHDEVEPSSQDGKYHKLVVYCCPNCRYRGQVEKLNPKPVNESGDRVLVLKPAYELAKPRRGDVVVFKFPEKPQEKFTAQNYIKRAMGFGGETLGIYRGELFVTTALDYPPDAIDDYGNRLYPRPESDKDLWRGDPSKDRNGKPVPLGERGPDYRYVNSRRAMDRFESSRRNGFKGDIPGEFEIIRKPDDHMLACRRIVWDNDHQPRDLVGRPPRWHDPLGQPNQPFVRWTTDNDKQPRKFAHTAAELDWVRYRHLVWVEDPLTRVDKDGQLVPDIEDGKVRTQLRPWSWDSPLPPAPGPIDNFLGYNAGIDMVPDPLRPVMRRTIGEDLWVGDLTLECEATLQNGAEVVLELSKGICRFRAVFGGGKVTLQRVTKPTREAPEQVEEIASRSCRVSGAGTYTLRFANVDCRLRVWVDGRAIDFGSEGDYPPGLTVPANESPDRQFGGGWTEANDIDAPASIGAKGSVSVQHVTLHRDIYYTNQTGGPIDLYYVHPGHYFCLGDNSSSSADSRQWGLVPERLMLGKAVFVFWPRVRIGFIK